MFENFAILILALLAQVNFTANGSGINSVLNQFVKNDAINEFVNNDNWSVYKQISDTEFEIRPLPHRISNDQIKIDSKSAIAFDVGTDYILYENNSRVKLPIASLTKIMTALIVLENNNLDDVVTINESAFNVLGRKDGLFAGERISVDHLLNIMLVSSNNIAANALAEHTSGHVADFVVLMNQKAVLLGLKDTKYFNSTGLDEGGPNLSTAYDLAQLVDYALKKPLIWKYTRMESAEINSIDNKSIHSVKNTNQLLGTRKDIVGGKTGFTDEAGECLILITNDLRDSNNQVITVVLHAQNRFLQTEKLQNWVWKNYLW